MDSIIPSAKIDTAKINQALRDYSKLPPNTKGKAAILESIRDQAADMGYNEQACYLSMDLARGHADRGQWDSVLLYYNYAAPFCDKPLFDKALRASYLAERGAFYYGLRSDFVNANKCYYDALNHMIQNGLTDTELTMSLYVFLHGTQDALGHREQALIYLKSAETIAKKLDSKQGIAVTAAHFGMYYSKQRNYDLALQYFDTSLTYESSIWDPNILTMALIGKAIVLAQTGKAASAIPILNKSISVSRKEEVIYSEVEAIIAMGEAYNKLGDPRRALKIVSDVIQQTPEGFTEKEKGYKVLMEGYELLGQFKDALYYQRLINNWNDSVGNLLKVAAMNELEISYQAAAKDNKIASNALMIAEQKNKLARKNLLLAIISAISLVALLVLIYVYKSAAHKQKVKELEIEALKAQQKIETLRSMMQGEEQERQRLSRELHDGIGSMLASAIMRLSLLKNEKIHPTEYEEILSLLQETGSEVRKTAQNMMPDNIYKQPLLQAIKSFCEGITLGTSLLIDVQFYGVGGEFTDRCKLVIYRIIQELVHNIIKHADATEAIVQGISDDGKFRLTVEDNGKGFYSLDEHRGMGLKNVEARVYSLNGDVTIESVKGKGTTVSIEFDCNILTEQ